MILIPEIKTVIILVPRTGTRSLKRAIEERYPESILLYRHMEADGVPQGYDRWRKIGVARNPVDRLWSLFKYLKRFGLDWCAEHDETYTAKMRDSVAQPFENWLTHNELVFTSPYDSAGLGRFYAPYTVRHPLPENRKSQFIYLRPDLGTEIVPYDHVGRLYAELEVNPPRLNVTPDEPAPELSAEAQSYARQWFAWDFQQSQSLEAAA